jgi:hypothetical protein
MSSRLVEMTSTDGYDVYTVLVNARSVAFIKPINGLSSLVKTKIVFTGGAELNVIESMEETEGRIKGNAGIVIPFRRE